MKQALEPLKEVGGTGQIENGLKRRWFSAQGVDLIVWFDDFDRPFTFQLCYEAGRKEFALTWEAGVGFSHTSIDSGEHGLYRYKSAPVLEGSAPFDPIAWRQRFPDIAFSLPSPVRETVQAALDQYPNSPATPARRPMKRIRKPETPARRQWWKPWA